MHEETAVKQGDGSSPPSDKNTPHEVVVLVNREPHKVAPGTYRVAEFKRLVNVPAEEVLEQVIKGQLVPLANDANVSIHGGEQFFAHVVRGGSA